MEQRLSAPTWLGARTAGNSRMTGFVAVVFVLASNDPGPTVGLGFGAIGDERPEQAVRIEVHP